MSVQSAISVLIRLLEPESAGLQSSRDVHATHLLFNG